MAGKVLVEVGDFRKFKELEKNFINRFWTLCNEICILERENNSESDLASNCIVSELLGNFNSFFEEFLKFICNNFEITVESPHFDVEYIGDIVKYCKIILTRRKIFLLCSRRVEIESMKKLKELSDKQNMNNYEEIIHNFLLIKISQPKLIANS